MYAGEFLQAPHSSKPEHGSLLTDFLGEMRAEPIDPEQDAFVANVHASLMS